MVDIMIKKEKRNAEAVSPVVGVMLMLVVTIIIASVVSAFSGGLVSNTQVAPQASIDVQVDTSADTTMGGTDYKMTFSLLSGDSIQTKNIAIVTYYENSSGHIYKNKQTATSNATDLYQYGTLTRVPFINDAKYGYAGDNPSVDFGNYTWSTGDVLSTGNIRGTAALLGLNVAESGDISDPDFGSGSVVDVKVLHVPSGQYIFDKEVIVK
ncbi:FlaG/FlaF family flagellin (archaellin) [Methanomicrobium sp. W14]|uniref:type IV pilin N-terminal domain-containing protein n=1 Tax=Methanomicrobium sp. W14 TaxID=2817839 RepID=UPI001FDA907C|nr:type IV pilin N-terminal domain-containing protein [Methanomicrobium sp. W14]MBP2133182.1 FlaG/FlaF family flagellin (archaellin) [Methanomicrobium sp. W14]